MTKAVPANTLSIGRSFTPIRDIDFVKCAIDAYTQILEELKHRFSDLSAIEFHTPTTIDGTDCKIVPVLGELQNVRVLRTYSFQSDGITTRLDVWVKPKQSEV